MVDFNGYCGSKTPSMLLVGEAWGENEAKMRQPFVGYSGKELFKMLGEAMPLVGPIEHARVCDLFRYDLAWANSRQQWLNEAGIGITSVFNFQPPANRVIELTVKKKELPQGYNLPPISSKGLYLDPQFVPGLDRLGKEIEFLKPNIVVALGNTALWALTGQINIGSVRGTVAQLASGQKFISTYHPMAVMHNWEQRPIVVMDLMKAAREALRSNMVLPQRQVIVNPTLDEMLEWTEQTLANLPSRLGADCETAKGLISCISFARSKSESLVIPFAKSVNGRFAGSYWATEQEEFLAWDCVKRLFEAPCDKVFQNGLYDLRYILPIGIRPTRLNEDTMLLHHAHYPEMLKGLGFLGSIYTDEASWKLMRRKRTDTEKRDE